jgi:hypothetical protein
MSCDYMVFEPEAAPTDQAEFMDWYTKQTEWAAGVSYDSPSITTPKIQALLKDVQKTYSDMKSFATEADFPEDDSILTGYSIAKDFVYADFRWSQSGPAYETVFQLAAKHQLGFFDLQSSHIWLPNGGTLV